jgi:uncharacterized repeat protein (TIGR04076 family)
MRLNPPMLPDSCPTPPVRITVLEVRSEAEPPCGYRAGDTWLVNSDETPPGICIWALMSMAPLLVALRFSGNVPWEADGSGATVCCSDPNNPVVFEVRRVTGDEAGASAG